MSYYFTLKDGNMDKDSVFGRTLENFPSILYFDNKNANYALYLPGH